jgi:hypothetical protein
MHRSGFVIFALMMLFSSPSAQQQPYDAVSRVALPTVTGPIPTRAARRMSLSI